MTDRELDLQKMIKESDFGQACEVIALAESFPVKGGNFLRDEQDGWFAQNKSAEPEQVS